MGQVTWSLGFTRRREDERIRQEVNSEDCQCLCFCEFSGGGHEGGGDERELT